MGIVVKQSIYNTISTYAGFAIGAVNTLFLYTNFLTPEYYGLVGFVLSAAVVIMPLMAFGVNNTLIKFYHSYKKREENDRFLSWMLVLPLLVIVPLGFAACVFQDAVLYFLSRKNTFSPENMWHIYLIAGAMAYFEVFYAWVRVHFRSIFGNFMKEVFHRILIALLLLSVYLRLLSPDEFINSLVGVYVLRMLVMMLVAFQTYVPKISFSTPPDFIAQLKYSAVIVLAGSITIVLLDIDKVMIGRYLSIENIAYYNVAIFIAAVIVVPARAMGQITTPVTARLINEKNWKSLDELYKKTSLNLLAISGWVFVLVVANIKQLYLLIDPMYATGLSVVLLIGSIKLFENATGNNHAILSNSDYYRWLIYSGVFLAVLAVCLNVWLIPKYGINGAACATFTSLALYYVLKLLLVYLKFSIQPFTLNTLKAVATIVFLVLGFYFWDLNFHPVINIILKSISISILYFLVIYYGKVSKEIIGILDAYKKRKF